MRSQQAVVAATEKLEKLIVEHAKPDQFGRAKVEVIIEAGQPVRLIECWEGMTKLTA